MTVSKDEKVRKKIKAKDIEKIKNPEKSEKKKKKNILIISIVFIVLIILVLFFSVIFAIIQRGKNTIAKGVSTRGIELSNLTVSSAKEKIVANLNEQTDIPIKLKYKDYSLDINLSEIEFSYDIDSTIDNAYKIGRESNIIKNNYEVLSTMISGKDIKLEYSYNKDALDKIIGNVDLSIPGRTEEYTYCIENTDLVLTPGKDGIIVEKDKLAKTIITSILNRDPSIQKEFYEIEIPVANKKADKIDIDKLYKEVYCEPKDAILEEEPFKLVKDEDGIDFAISIDEAKALLTEDKEEYIIPLKITKANQTVADLGAKVFPQLLGTYSTSYDAGYKARATNLELAGEKINGTILMPGEEFSFNKVVGKRTVEGGYQNAPVYENGKVVDGIAGGICQISSTLYNAVLLANLEITERRNHSFVSTYVPAGTDATVVYGVQDFKFKNSRKYPIQLQCSVSGGIAKFDIKGIKEEVEYKVRIVTNTTATIPFSEEIIEDSSIEPGTKKVVQSGHNGVKVSSYKILYLDGKEVSRTLLYNDTYSVMNKITKVSPQTVKKQQEQNDSNTLIIEDLPTQNTASEASSQTEPETENTNTTDTDSVENQQIVVPSPEEVQPQTPAQAETNTITQDTVNTVNQETQTENTNNSVSNVSASVN